MQYEEKKFTLPELQGLSKDAVAQHLALYAGYVKNFNAISAALAEHMKDSGGNAHVLAELVRRLPFEFDGMRLHEYYFAQWEHAPAQLPTDEPLGQALAAQFGSYEAWEHQFKGIAAMRGPGWALLYYDPQAKQFHNVWVGEHQVGHYATLPLILALDVWEHAFVIDFGTTGRGKYIEVCFANYNWSVMSERYQALAH